MRVQTATMIMLSTLACASPQRDVSIVGGDECGVTQADRARMIGEANECIGLAGIDATVAVECRGPHDGAAGWAWQSGVVVVTALDAAGEMSSPRLAGLIAHELAHIAEWQRHRTWVEHPEAAAAERCAAEMEGK